MKNGQVDLSLCGQIRNAKKGEPLIQVANALFHLFPDLTVEQFLNSAAPGTTPATAAAEETAAPKASRTKNGHAKNGHAKKEAAAAPAKANGKKGDGSSSSLLTLLKSNGSEGTSVVDAATALGGSAVEARRVLALLIKEGKVRKKGNTRATRYYLK